MLGKKENKSLLELFQWPQLDKEIFENSFHPSSGIKRTYRKFKIFKCHSPSGCAISTNGLSVCVCVCLCEDNSEPCHWSTQLSLVIWLYDI